MRDRPPFTRSQLFKRRLAALYNDQLPGGTGDDSSPEDFDPAALQKGTEQEMEHTLDPELAQELAVDHLAQDPNYYDKVQADVPSTGTGIKHLMTALHRLVGSKRYLQDLELLFKKMSLSHRDDTTLSLLARDLEFSGSNHDSQKFWRGGF